MSIQIRKPIVGSGSSRVHQHDLLVRQPERAVQPAQAVRGPAAPQLQATGSRLQQQEVRADGMATAPVRAIASFSGMNSR
jgi:hypothetical protein